MSITPEQRREWGNEAVANGDYPRLALLDALDAAERERDGLSESYAPLLEWSVERAESFAEECGASEGSLFVAWVKERKRAEQAEATLARVRALADTLAVREGMASSNMRDPDMAADRSYYEGMRDALDLAETDLRAALDGADR